MSMRSNQNQRRNRGRGGGGGGSGSGGGGGGSRRPQVVNRNQIFDSNGPEGKVRGNPSQVLEKYVSLAHDAFAAGDRVRAENFYQHAEHYYRMLHDSMDPTDARPVDSRPVDSRPMDSRPMDSRQGHPSQQRPAANRQEEQNHNGQDRLSTDTLRPAPRARHTKYSPGAEGRDNQRTPKPHEERMPEDAHQVMPSEQATAPDKSQKLETQKLEDKAPATRSAPQKKESLKIVGGERDKKRRVRRPITTPESTPASDTKEKVELSKDAADKVGVDQDDAKKGSADIEKSQDGDMQGVHKTLGTKRRIVRRRRRADDEETEQLELESGED